VVAVALGPSVYLWNSGSGSITQLVSLGEQEGLVTSVSFSAGGEHVAVGTQGGEVQLWDVEAARRVRRVLGHSGRVGASSWNPTQSALLSTGSRDSLVLTHDSRAARTVIATHDMHSQEVCGVRWSPDGSQLATGGNDNLLCVWDLLSSSDKPRHVMEQHTAAVKALAWCPWQSSLLASGGGTADRCIRFWNTATGGCVNSIDTKSQVCAIQWSKHSRELVSSHGFSQNQLIVWNYPSVRSRSRPPCHHVLTESPPRCSAPSTDDQGG
jgi:cell division cycle protein 20 (cofactor of APC complex)